MQVFIKKKGVIPHFKKIQNININHDIPKEKISLKEFILI
jgi:hypothetical protein